MDNELAIEVQNYIQAFNTDNSEAAMDILESASPELIDAILLWHMNNSELTPEEERAL